MGGYVPAPCAHLAYLAVIFHHRYSPPHIIELIFASWSGELVICCAICRPVNRQRRPASGASCSLQRCIIFTTTQSFALSQLTLASMCLRRRTTPPCAQILSYRYFSFPFRHLTAIYLIGFKATAARTAIFLQPPQPCLGFYLLCSYIWCT